MSPRKPTGHQILLGLYDAYRALSWRTYAMQALKAPQRGTSKGRQTPPRCPGCRLFVRVPPCGMDATCPYCPGCCPGHDQDQNQDQNTGGR